MEIGRGGKWVEGGREGRRGREGREKGGKWNVGGGYWYVYTWYAIGIPTPSDEPGLPTSGRSAARVHNSSQRAKGEAERPVYAHPDITRERASARNRQMSGNRTNQETKTTSNKRKQNRKTQPETKTKSKMNAKAKTKTKTT